MSESELRACIFQGVAALVGFITLLVCACIYLPALNEVTGTAAFRNGALVAVCVGIFSIFANAFFVHSHAFQRATHILVAIGVTALMIVAAHSVSTKTTVPIAMALAALAVGVAVPLGFHQRSMKRWLLPTFFGLLVLVAASFMNVFLFKAHWVETLISLVAVVLFVVLTVVDANVFVKHPELCKFNCCEEGTFSIYLNFSNLVVELMSLMH